jgi:hypothetical protein
MTVWQSIAPHTTRQVPNYLEPEVRLVALGVQHDVRIALRHAHGRAA